MNPDTIRLFMFDYDGTLRDSMNPDVPGTKPSAFAQAVIDHHPTLNVRRDEVKQLYFATSRMNRIRQLHLVEERFGLTPIAAEKENEWSERFDSYINEREMPLFPEAATTIAALKLNGYLVGICSSVPQEKLVEVVSYFPTLKDNLDFILRNQKWSKAPGREANFLKGLPYVAWACGRYNLQPEQIAFVGDAEEDMRVGYDAGTFTIGRVDSRIPGRREVLAQHQPDLLVNSLDEILSLFLGK
ncbi:HAD family hydrolase [Candidatus Woesearchaeota archaeon]|nr:HAD family hydrolase [Candidatus Woesearchaeota archaeon]